MFQFSSIEQYHADLKSGRTTCTQAVRHFLSRIEQTKSLNLFITVFAQEALARAEALDALPPTGLLHGVVVGLKDTICYKGRHVSAASGILQHFTSLYSATAVNRLLQEGAIIIGRQNCDEFGMGSTNENSTYGPAIHPLDKSRVTGGSSGGSAAAVKAGLCMASLGSDTGGSVRLPADFCGVVGYKPSYGRVSRHGLIAYASSFDVIGVLANSVADASALARVISGPDSFDSTTRTESLDYSILDESDKKYRIAFFPEWLDHPSIDPQISTAIKNCLNNLKQQGHSVEAAPFPLTDFIVPTYYILTTAEASSNLSRYDGVRYGPKPIDQTQELPESYQQARSAFGKEVKRRIMLGSFVLSAGYYDAYYTKAQQVRMLLKQQAELIFNDFDFIISPNAPSVAYKAGDDTKDKLAVYMGDIFTVFANLTGIPGISLPLFKHSSNLPFGLQVLSAAHNEVSLQRFSHHLMQQ